MIVFSVSDNLRSIPCICDGFKPGQRKILYSCFLKKLKSEIKVAQLSGYVSEKSAYHHGEISLQQTIIGLAQRFVGSNNISLLDPNGQFGTRDTGGKDSASARYIFTNLSQIARKIFIEEDDHVVNYLEDDGERVEPEWYIPVIPMCLINGAEGIGTGWSTYIPNYNYRDIANELKQKLVTGKPFNEIHPWFKGFQGQIVKIDEQKYDIYGKFQIDPKNDYVQITELPLRKWTRDYKEFLHELAEGDKPGPKIEDIQEYHAQDRVNFLLQLAKGEVAKWEKNNGGLFKAFKLGSTFTTTNYVMFDDNYKLTRYKSANEILEKFYDLRLKLYGKRKDYMTSQLNRDLAILTNKVKFIQAILNDQINVKNIKKKQLGKLLYSKGFTPMKDMPNVQSTKLQNSHLLKIVKEDGNPEEEEEVDIIQEENDEDLNFATEYNYLMQLPLWSLTYEKVQEFQEQLKKKEQELKLLLKLSIEQMWITDLDNFIKACDIMEEMEESERLNKKINRKGRKEVKQQKTKKNQKKIENLNLNWVPGQVVAGTLLAKSKGQKKKKERNKSETKSQTTSITNSVKQSQIIIVSSSKKRAKSQQRDKGIEQYMKKDNNNIENKEKKANSTAGQALQKFQNKTKKIKTQKLSGSSSSEVDIREWMGSSTSKQKQEQQQSQPKKANYLEKYLNQKPTTSATSQIVKQKNEKKVEFKEESKIQEESVSIGLREKKKVTYLIDSGDEEEEEHKQKSKKNRNLDDSDSDFSLQD